MTGHIGWEDRHEPPREAFCGTYPGYQRHLRLGEQPCEECRRASADYRREHRARTDRGGTRWMTT